MDSPITGENCGIEWVVEAHGCDPGALTDAEALSHLFEDLIEAMDLHPVDDPAWHRFPVTGGYTGFQMLSESHLACHSFPEFGSLCLNVFCCRPRPDAAFARLLENRLRASRVQVRRIERPYSA